MPGIDTAVLPTPIAPLSLLADAGVLVASGFDVEAAELHARLPEPRRSLPLRRMADLGPLSRDLAAYFAGDLTALDAVAVDQAGTEHLQRLWLALRQVPPGTTISYSELASRSGSPGAARAAGSACARNLVAPVVPCHRVVHRDGSLGGYGYGLPAKRWLLDHERSHAADTYSAVATGSRLSSV